MYFYNILSVWGGLINYTDESATLNISGEQDRAETLNKNKYENVDMSLFYTYVHKFSFYMRNE